MLERGNEITIAVDPLREEASPARRRYVRRPRTTGPAFENGSWKKRRGSRHSS
jgi:hypothetical protein